MPTADWQVYIIEATDGSLYTGISTDAQRRFDEHADGGPKAARYFRGRTPRRLVYTEGGHTQSSALKREAAIKRLPRAAKLALIAD